MTTAAQVNSCHLHQSWTSLKPSKGCRVWGKSGQKWVIEPGDPNGLWLQETPPWELDGQRNVLTPGDPQFLA